MVRDMRVIAQLHSLIHEVAVRPRRQLIMQQCQLKSRSFALFPSWANYIGWVETTSVSAMLM